jgi:hypothetical protein
MTIEKREASDDVLASSTSGGGWKREPDAG